MEGGHREGVSTDIALTLSLGWLLGERPRSPCGQPGSGRSVHQSHQR